jgi:hypothetical protein
MLDQEQLSISKRERSREKWLRLVGTHRLGILYSCVQTRCGSVTLCARAQNELSSG